MQIESMVIVNLHKNSKTLSNISPKLKDKIPGVLQGDLLFTDDKDSRLVNNEQCVTFQPNTIVYAIPSASNLGNVPLRAKLGIVFHTTYIGPSLNDLNAQFGADVSQLQGDPDVMVFSSDFKDATGSASMTRSF